MNDKKKGGLDDLDSRSISHTGPIAWFCDRGRPAVEPLGILDAHINTAVAHATAKIIVPVGAVESDPGHMLEKTGPGYTRQLVGIDLGGQLAVSHVLGWQFGIDIKLPAWGFSWNTCHPPQAG